MPQITYILDGKPTVVTATKGQSVLQIGLDANLPIIHSCGGNGFCTTCNCQVLSGAEALSPMNDNEESMGMVEPKRLSCQTVYEGDTDVVVEVLE